MRDSDPAIIAALQAAPRDGIVPRQLVWITATKLSDGSTGTFGFWNERLPVTLEVVGGSDGIVVARTYQADGALVSVGKITLTADITVRTASFVLSMAHPLVQQLWGEYQLKLAKVEIHRVPLDTTTRLPVAPPRCRFRGRVDTAPKQAGTRGQSGSLTINCISTAVGLTLVNPAKRSDATQQRRSGDRHSRYAGVAGQWSVPWGKSS
jgi:hypothetical protein